MNDRVQRALSIARSPAYDDRSRLQLRLADPRVKHILEASYKIDRSRDIPYLAGISRDGRTLYVDRRFPWREEYRPLLWLHEAVEFAFMKLFHDGYDAAHRLATIVEKEYAQRHDVDWKQYQSMINELARRLRHEPIKNVPRDLFQAPYEQANDWDLLRRMRQAMR